MPPAVLLDLDGTLVTFAFDVKGSRQAIMDLLVRRGFDVSALNLTDPTQKAIDLVMEQTKAGVVRDSYLDTKAAIFTLLDGFEIDSSARTALFQDTLAALDALRASAIRLAVLTNSGSIAVNKILERFGIARYFEFVLTRDSVPAMKPRPDGVLKAVASFGLPRERVWYVGDSVLDVFASKAAGVKCASVATGNYAPERLRSEGADLVVSSLSDLPQALVNR